MEGLGPKGNTSPLTGNGMTHAEKKTLRKTRGRNTESIGSGADADKVRDTEGVSLQEQKTLKENIRNQQQISNAQLRDLGVSQEPDLNTIIE